MWITVVGGGLAYVSQQRKDCTSKSTSSLMPISGCTRLGNILASADVVTQQSLNLGNLGIATCHQVSGIC